LNQGDKVKVTIMFRGREQSRPELGFRLLEQLSEDIEEIGYVEFAPKQEGRNMTMVIAPVKKKSEVKGARSQQRRDRERRDEERAQRDRDRQVAAAEKKAAMKTEVAD
jgi:translation initiation factor IF-3